MTRQFVATNAPRQPVSNHRWDELTERIARQNEQIQAFEKEAPRIINSALLKAVPPAMRFKLPGAKPRAATLNAVTAGFKLPKGDVDSGNTGNPTLSGFKLPR